MNEIIKRLHALKDRGVKIKLMGRAKNHILRNIESHVMTNAPPCSPEDMTLCVHTDDTEDDIVRSIGWVESCIRVFDKYNTTTDIYKEIDKKFGDN